MSPQELLEAHRALWREAFSVKYTFLEVLCHLYDVEREDFRQHLDSILHRPTEEWELIDPASWITERAYNERDLTEALDSFLAEREKSLI